MITNSSPPGLPAPSPLYLHSQASYTGQVWTSSIGFWLRFSSKNSDVPLQGFVISEFSRGALLASVVGVPFCMHADA